MSLIPGVEQVQFLHSHGALFWRSSQSCQSMEKTLGKPPRETIHPKHFRFCPHLVTLMSVQTLMTRTEKEIKNISLFKHLKQTSTKFLPFPKAPNTKYSQVSLALSRPTELQAKGNIYKNNDLNSTQKVSYTFN